MCKVNSVIYECICVICDAKNKSGISATHDGRYVGDTYRSLNERASEHFAALRRMDPTGFMSKYWALCHKDLDVSPEFRFKVLSKARDPMTRKITEAVTISYSNSTMKNLAECGGYRISRLSVDLPEW